MIQVLKYGKREKKMKKVNKKPKTKSLKSKSIKEKSIDMIHQIVYARIVLEDVLTQIKDLEYSIKIELND